MTYHFSVDEGGAVQQSMLGDGDDAIPSHELPDYLTDKQAACRFCYRQIRFGMTKKGKRGGKGKPAAFDADPPHRNHWITCPEADKAREAYKR